MKAIETQDFQLATQLQTKDCAKSSLAWFCQQCFHLNVDWSERICCGNCQAPNEVQLQLKKEEEEEEEVESSPVNKLTTSIVNKIRNATSASQKPVISFDLCKKFVLKYFELRNKLTRHLCEPKVVYHWTKKHNFEGIEEKGLLVPDGSKVKHTTDLGYYGKGIYTSPDPDYASVYGDGKDVFVCLSLPGRQYSSTYPNDLGKPCRPNYDSHISNDQNGGKEWVFFDSSQLLLCYLMDRQYLSGITVIMKEICDCLNLGYNNHYGHSQN